MTTPVTRGEMHEALGLWAGAIIAQLTTQLTTQLTAALAAQTAEMGKMMNALLDGTKAEIMGEVRAMASTSERSILDRMNALLEPHESVPARVEALEEQALPERVGKLEAKVFAPRRRAKAARRTRS